MLKKFNVENFKGFKDRISLDIGSPSNYGFHPEVIEGNCITKGIIYGINGCGKSNLGLAIFDIITHLTEKQKLHDELFSRIQAGDVVEGTVKNVTDFGAFIDLGGADGLLHISEMSWGHVENPKKVFKVGENLKVLIKSINPESGKIALSLKFPDSNPWLTAADKYQKDAVVSGKVARMTDFGAFVELEPGVDALLHVSQISHNHVDKPSDVLQIGQEIEAKVVEFNGEDRKISLSMKALENNSQEPADESVEEDSTEE